MNSGNPVNGIAKNREYGGALLAILIVIAVIASLINHQTAKMTNLTRTTQSHIQFSQALQYAEGLEDYAIELLLEDKTTSIDYYGEPWGSSAMDFKIDGAYTTLSIEDLQGRFNINNIVNSDGSLNEPQFRFFENMLLSLHLDEVIARRVADWIDRDRIPRTGYTEDSNFNNEKPPFYSADNSMSDPSEIFPSNITGEDLTVLLKNITTLPQNQRLNVNTLSENVFSLITGTPADISTPTNTGAFNTPQEFTTKYPHATSILPISSFSTSSNYYLIKSRVEYLNINLTISTYVFRSDTEPKVIILHRKILPFSPTKKNNV